METTVPTDPIVILLADIGKVLPAMPADELLTIAHHWQRMATAAQQVPYYQGELLRQLGEVISASPTLLRHHFDERFPQPIRYDLNAVVRPQAAPSTIPVRNEVVYQINQLNATIQHQVTH